MSDHSASGHYVPSLIGEPLDPVKAQLREEQFRLATIENYRQTVALQVMVMLAKDADDMGATEAAKKARAWADALVEQLFPEES